MGEKDEEIQAMILHYGAEIRETNLIEQKEAFLNSGEIYVKDLVGASVTKGEFYGSVINKAVYEKYQIRHADGTPSWNNLGDLIQYYAILFYETCLHAMVLGELKE